MLASGVTVDTPTLGGPRQKGKRKGRIGGRQARERRIRRLDAVSSANNLPPPTATRAEGPVLLPSELVNNGGLAVVATESEGERGVVAARVGVADDTETVLAGRER
jgi:hypothetical protein